ncbi:MAG: hypothetical protein GEU78_14990 [Actinobacteria bacterium]|nr:hypothetical protein [Actinomycetota bacterium]
MTVTTTEGEQRARLMHAAYRNGASLTQTAALFGLSKSAVHQAFTRYDLPRRPPRVNRGPLPTSVRPPDDAPPWPVPVGRVPARPEQDWHTRAACTDLPTDLFYPNHNIQTVKDIDRRVVDACNRCPVLPDCLAAGLNDVMAFGEATPQRTARGCAADSTAGVQHELAATTGRTGPRPDRRRSVRRAVRPPRRIRRRPEA